MIVRAPRKSLSLCAQQTTDVILELLSSLKKKKIDYFCLMIELMGNLLTNNRMGSPILQRATGTIVKS